MSDEELAVIVRKFIFEDVRGHDFDSPEFCDAYVEFVKAVEPFVGRVPI